MQPCIVRPRMSDSSVDFSISTMVEVPRGLRDGFSTGTFYFLASGSKCNRSRKLSASQLGSCGSFRLRVSSPDHPHRGWMTIGKPPVFRKLRVMTVHIAWGFALPMISCVIALLSRRWEFRISSLGKKNPISPRNNVAVQRNPWSLHKVPWDESCVHSSYPMDDCLFRAASWDIAVCGAPPVCHIMLVISPWYTEMHACG